METIPVAREVIAGKLLTALDDKEKVAVVLSREDLDLLLHALVVADENKEFPLYNKRRCELTAGLAQLRREAFGK